jgi:hypothetical protein
MMKEYPLIPDIFVIGAMKGGTSTLHRNILVHPAICRTRKKEVNFFLNDEPAVKTENRYRNQFANPDLIKCDVSPKYSQDHNHPGVAARIFRANPAARIIYIIRDPVERAISHLHHNLLRDRYNQEDVEGELRSNPDYIMVSQYYHQISRYLDVFPRNQVSIFQLEELVNSPDVFCGRMSDFLELNEPLENKTRKFNVSERRYKIKYYDFVHNHISSPRLIKLYHYFWLFMNLKAPKPDLSRETRAYLRSALQDDVNLLASEFQIDLRLWPNFKHGDGQK